MIARFRERTLRHIELVRENLTAMDGFLGLEMGALRARADAHDRSKFSKKEAPGYAWLTWLYGRRAKDPGFACPPEISAAIEAALLRHRARNAHHPESHAAADAMSGLDVVEMVCDWTAIAQETGAVSARSWAAANLRLKWDFGAEKRRLIFRTIAELDRRNLHAGRGPRTRSRPVPAPAS